MKLSLLFVPIVFLLSCGRAPQTHYYALDYDLPVKSDDSVIDYLWVKQFIADAVCEKDNLVYRETPYEVKFDPYRRWIAAPAKMLTEKSIEYFRQSGFFRQVADIPPSKPFGMCIKGNLGAFEEVYTQAGRVARIYIWVQLGDIKEDKAVWSELFTGESAIKANGAEGIAKAMSEAARSVFEKMLKRIKKGETIMALDQLLPASISGWRPQHPDAYFTGKDIFDYMNGAGEIYLAFGFNKLLVREYEKADESMIVAELYQMPSSADAYGIFSHDRDGENINIGQDGLYGAGLLHFWQDKVFVRIFAERETKASKAAVLELGQYIDQAIGENGARPDLLKCMPPEGRIESSVRYFHTQVILNVHFYLSEENILDLNMQTEALLSDYRTDEKRVTVLLARYPNTAAAQKSYTRFKTYLCTDSKEKDDLLICPSEKGTYNSAFCMDRYLILVFDALREEVNKVQTSAVIHKIKECVE